ncbi:uncharacterized protein BDW70DRAFT_111534 [Aspergillus foveolatus]|uniref:uncharacterized protein n=1 Tax=Aspergillus foveolatus TaxID=210207 RepID=UPI003CCDD3EC
MSMATVACKGIYDSLVYLNSLVLYSSRSSIATLLHVSSRPEQCTIGWPSELRVGCLPSSTSIPVLLLHTPLLSSLRLGPSRNNKSRWRRPRLPHPTSTAPLACLQFRKAKVRCLVSHRLDRCNRCIAHDTGCVFSPRGRG